MTEEQKPSQVGPIRSSSEHRKSTKPIMEKRRRARINQSLAELKTLILDAMKKDSSRHSKLEKADILEMTVKHLQALQRQQMAVAVNSDPSVLAKYRAGYSECAQEVTRYLSNMDGLDAGVRTRMVTHLTGGMHVLDAQVRYGAVMQGSGAGMQALQLQGMPAVPSAGLPTVSVLPKVQYADATTRMYGGFGLQLIPSTLPSGEIAFMLPNQQLPPGGLQAGHVIPVIANVPDGGAAAAMSTAASAVCLSSPPSAAAGSVSPASTTSSSSSSSGGSSQSSLSPGRRSVSPPAGKAAPSVSPTGLLPPHQEPKEEDMWRPW
ncbi:PREDICTED: transcription factor HES-4-like isoform X2 [Priapulus caudatus]|uniref:Transcription factor HES-4-like isoform X2 n=1 Tax=Priapulus caudatus TaxID=37621 RepID=A0ABM1EH68_PRICU|nr:PREDICTED: transcription factor HES-4-like isoform X2 [Priapulus caudatus]